MESRKVTRTTRNTGLRKAASEPKTISSDPGLASTNTWRQRALVFGHLCGVRRRVSVGAHVVLPMLRAPDGHYVLADPDSYMHWRLVTRALNGEGVRIRWMNEDNAPFGRMNE